MMSVSSAANASHRPCRIPRQQQHHHHSLPLPQPQQPIKPPYTITYLNPMQQPHVCTTHPPPPPRLRLPMPPPPPTVSAPLAPTAPYSATVPVDLYRKRKLAQRAQQQQHQLQQPPLPSARLTNTAATNATEQPDNTATNKKPKPTPYSQQPPLSPPHKKPNNNPVSSPTHRLAQRQKQLDMGYTTPAYRLYLSCVRLERREEAQREGGQPVTPRKEQACSKRSWDGQVRKWRRQLHEWDEGGRMYAQWAGSAAATAVSGGESANGARHSSEVAMDGGSGEVTEHEQREADEVAVDEDEQDGDEDEDDWRESIVRMAGALPD